MKKEVAEVEFTILMYKPATSGDRNGNSSRIEDSRRLSVGEETLCNAVRLTEYRYQEKT